jgi:hypothetical protein
MNLKVMEIRKVLKVYKLHYTDGLKFIIPKIFTI